MEGCIFCKIVSGVIPTTIIFQNEDVIAFPDLHPQAPVHMLIIPKKHMQSLNEINDAGIIIKMIEAAKQVARDKGIYDRGYKLVVNTGEEGGQVIQHFHLHLLGGKKLEG